MLATWMAAVRHFSQASEARRASGEREDQSCAISVSVCPVFISAGANVKKKTNWKMTHSAVERVFRLMFIQPQTHRAGHRAVHGGWLRPAVLLHPRDPRSRQRHPHRQHEPRRVPDDCWCRPALHQPGDGLWRRSRRRRCDRRRRWLVVECNRVERGRIRILQCNFEHDRQ